MVCKGGVAMVNGVLCGAGIVSHPHGSKATTTLGREVSFQAALAKLTEEGLCVVSEDAETCESSPVLSLHFAVSLSVPFVPGRHCHSKCHCQRLLPSATP